MQIEDIPSMLNFQTCLIHYINYQFLDILPTKFPTIITKYNFEDNGGEDIKCYSRLDSSKLSRIGKIIFNNCVKLSQKYKQTLYLLKRLKIVTKTKWNCLAQFYLYPVPKLIKHDEQLITQNMLTYYYDFGVDSTQIYGSYSDLALDPEKETSRITITSRNAYRFLVSRIVTSVKDWTSWNMLMDRGIMKFVSTFLFQVVTNLHLTEIVKVSIACLVCDPFSNPLEEVDITVLNINFITTMYRKNFLHRNSIRTSFQFKIRDDTPASHIVSTYETGKILDRQDVEVSRILYGVIFPNYTETSADSSVLGSVSDPCHKEESTKECIGIVLSFLAKDDFTSNVRITLKRMSVSYLTCFDTQHEKISFQGFLSAFDMYTWICIVTVSFTAVGLLLTGLYSFNLQCSFDSRAFLKGTILSEVFLALVGIVLEQGQYYVSWRPKKKTCASLVIVPALFGGLIISNAYKGENINQITAPFSHAKFDTLDAIISNRFKVYSSTMSGFSRPNFTLLDEILIDMKKSDRETKVVSKFKYLHNNQIRFRQQHIICFGDQYLENFRDIIRKWNADFQFPDILKYLCMWPKQFLQRLSKCDNVAYFEDDDFLKLFLLPALKYTGKESATYNVGKEKIPHSSFGTTFYNVRFPGIEQRLHLVLSSGIPVKLYATYEEEKRKRFYRSVSINPDDSEDPNQSAEYFVNAVLRGLSKLKEFYEFFMHGISTRQPLSLTIQGNVISLFVACSTLIFIAAVLFAFEITLHNIQKDNWARLIDRVLYQFLKGT